MLTGYGTSQTGTNYDPLKKSKASRANRRNLQCFADAKSDPNDPIPTTEEGMVKEIMSEFGFGLLEAINIVRRVQVV